MNTDEKVLTLFYAMTSYAKGVYDNLFELAKLEKMGKKNDKAYYNVLDNLREIQKKETKLYKDNIDLIISKRGELFYLATNNSSIYDLDILDLLSEFDTLAIYQRIKMKLKYHIGLNETFNKDVLSKLKINHYEDHTPSEFFLDESFLSDMQKMSLFYMENDISLDNRKIDYKYLTALIFNLDTELIDNYFEITQKKIYLDSTLIYKMNGLYKDIYIMDLTKVMIDKFSEFVNYIDLIYQTEDKDKDYKAEIALNYLKSILDLLPIDIKEEFYNEFIMDYSDDFSVPKFIKLKVLNAMQDVDKGRKLIRQISLGPTDNWFI